ncbi:Carboxy-terminal processing protease CtpB precursor [Poriferisphaera corsica]|uniref:Carboxy-terminal processing protease CtpB n=1 Tax=Poriferisphaera corsica TaxID=2528020 RepID=A0A517YUC6_9BACT|nr:S41 family peptidase [Poriferisphaera corsica]QDU33853.1 Carboxy-terminal processing protease CtpB precursor [Poriferisphaera corsica]
MTTTNRLERFSCQQVFTRCAVFLLSLFLILSLSRTASAIETPPAPTSSDAANYTAIIDTGNYDALLKQIDQLKSQDPDNQRYTRLEQAIERYQEHQNQRYDTRQDAYDEAITKMAEAIDNQRLEDALVAAIDAHSLAINKSDFLKKPETLEVVSLAEQRGQNAVDNDNWVDALSMYRLLDLLFENQNIYTDQIKNAEAHVRVLQLYTPQQLQNLYQARAERRAKEKGEDAPEPIDIEIDSWKSKLKNVNSIMLRDSLRQAVSRHIDRNQPGSNGYTSLLRGGVKNLLTLLNTKALKSEFKGLNNQPQVDKFKTYLTQVQDRLNDPAKRMNFLDAFKLLDEITRMNDITVDLPNEIVVYELTEGAMGQLDDFTAVIWPEDIETFSRSTEGKFYGVGIQISRQDGQLIVVSPLANTPAQRAGLKAGDIIAKVNGTNTSTWSLDRAVREITGEEGTPVTLTIERKGQADPIDFTINRAEIEIESIRGWEHTETGGWDYWIDPDDSIAYIRLSQFLPQTAKDLDKALQNLQKQHQIKGLILDLRFNPGGLLTSAVEVSDRFLSEGTIVSTVNAAGEKSIVATAKRRTTYPKFPIAILVNQGSASASEIVSGALQDYGRATIIGSRSFGKGSVQDLYPLDRRSAYLKLTTQYYMLPAGRIIHRKPTMQSWGIEPDINIDMTTREDADALLYRQAVDIIRDKDGNPTAAIDDQTIEVENPDADEIEKLEQRKRLDNATAQKIIIEGIDPQLEASLLWLQLQIASEDLPNTSILKAALAPAEPTTTE